MAAQVKTTQSKSLTKRNAAPKRKKITFGSVTVEVDPTDEEEIQKNIVKGQEAFARLIEWASTSKSGVNIKFKKDVPYYHADPENHSRLIRILNGKTDKVVFSKEKNEFVVCK